MDVVSTLVVAFWAMLPAYVPNNAAVLLGGGRPIDGGRTLGERRVLGDGKTWRGTIVGTAVGVALALGLSELAPTVGDAANVTLPTFPLPVAFALALGAMLGDIGASFLKRRTGRERGAAFPGLDQLDFVVGALALTAVVDPAWFGEWFTWPVLAVVVVLTPLLHIGTNGVAYVLDLKQEPW
ncbi:CDP-2,3-bis-(O-geranylgeranyl)-sn-glycerol synthase [Haloarchaeobius salinus]|uniref:CDP-2,3-bis-(O-geranylgeranyl)-sn-glycerol synthase n=1 Tax=Haloarchaeobius salinus TaxID=1198298 RepID=UPI00210D0D95|nr:CDP-2,3-bis-(O-geranylgeranyl)-sn-glycerol synthase [Haloarchaeobius salinus]